MKSIYENVKEVSNWFGPKDNDSDLALRTIKALVRRVKDEATPRGSKLAIIRRWE
ncbi:hypothetical protein K432DRAFT_383173 [Lepidopterella palustris CBS 459.81]|uniref:Uncharacterized protein n=1 Tax=Lepidopterella palustris CBS 459.81 TaxID=1314670 RepID=A0A8E2JEE0_9PEZI|nr:hypothetical protein K432DRAFT_383173 [Lepidopterella palustris CBS 459.81]